MSSDEGKPRPSKEFKDAHMFVIDNSPMDRLMVTAAVTKMGSFYLWLQAQITEILNKCSAVVVREKSSIELVPDFSKLSQEDKAKLVSLLNMWRSIVPLTLKTSPNLHIISRTLLNKLTVGEMNISVSENYGAGFTLGQAETIRKWATERRKRSEVAEERW
ncbi:MAG: hypothetical protein QXH59_08190 [Candidatus Caldarchaeum sp.]